MIAYGKHGELLAQSGGRAWIDLTLNIEAERILPAWRSLPGLSHLDVVDGRVTALVDDSNALLPRLFELATQAGARITTVDIPASMRVVKFGDVRMHSDGYVRPRTFVIDSPGRHRRYLMNNQLAWGGDRLEDEKQ